MDTDTDRKMREALSDPAVFEVTITGRNGFTVSHRYPLFDYEVGEITNEVEINRNEIWELGMTQPSGWEHLPHRRMFRYTLETRVGNSPTRVSERVPSDCADAVKEIE